MHNFYFGTRTKLSFNHAGEGTFKKIRRALLVLFGAIFLVFLWIKFMTNKLVMLYLEPSGLMPMGPFLKSSQGAEKVESGAGGKFSGQEKNGMCTRV